MTEADADNANPKSPNSHLIPSNSNNEINAPDSSYPDRPESESSPLNSHSNSSKNSKGEAEIAMIAPLCSISASQLCSMTVGDTNDADPISPSSPPLSANPDDGIYAPDSSHPGAPQSESSPLNSHSNTSKNSENCEGEAKRDTIQPLRILICSANVGNAEPTASSMASWIPNDGLVSDVVHKKIDETEEITRDGYFDIIAIGMQEASFKTKIDESIGDNQPPLQTELVSNNVKTDGIQTIHQSLIESERKSPISKSEHHTKGKLRRPFRAESERKPSTRKIEHNIKGKLRQPFSAVHAQLRSVAGSQDQTKLPRHVRMKNKLNGKKTPAENGVDDTQEDDRSHKIHKRDTKVLDELISARCPSYSVPVKYMRGEMRLIVLIRKDLMVEVQDVDYKAKNTGIGSVLANKGGIVATITIRKTRLSFISCHLAAHEGDKFYSNRCNDITDILGGAKVGGFPRKGYDTSLSSHHCFLCGDLNFRITLPESSVDLVGVEKPDKALRHEKHVNAVMSLVGKKDWATLNACDELAKALMLKDCLVGFRTIPCNFPPTFKVKREEGFVYTDQRSPSYTDRILWKSLYGLEGNIQPLAYGPCPSFITSDHKPIRGCFSVIPNDRKLFSAGHRHSLPPPVKKQKLHILVSDMKCTNLTSMDLNGKSDPYIKFVTDPVNFLIKSEDRMDDNNNAGMNKRKNSTEKEESERGKVKRSKWPRTRLIKKTLDPDWGDDEVVLNILDVSDNPDLTGSMLFLTVMDSDYHDLPTTGQGIAAGDDHIGTVPIDLHRLVAESSLGNIGEPIYITAPVMKNGLVRGQLSCSFLPWWIEQSSRGGLNPPRADITKRKGQRRVGKGRGKKHECSVM